MTTERTYRCDLCNEQIKDNVTSGRQKLGIGIIWSSSMDGSIDKKNLLMDAEHHLCLECIRAIKELDIQ